MSLFRSMFGIGSPRAPGASAAPGKSGASGQRPVAAVVGDTESVRRIAARLGELPSERARFVAAFAYLLARAASVDLAVSEPETAEMARLIGEEGGLDPATARLVVELAGTRVEQFGATDDYLVTREFKAISTPAERERLLRCCLLVAAADTDIDARESWLVNRIAEELDVPRADLNRIREAFTDRLAGVADLRHLRERAAADALATVAPAPELPEGVRIEQIWLAEVPYTPEARERRPALRPQHLARLLRLRLQGRVIEAGGTADFEKAVLLVRADSEAEVRELIEQDVYTSGGVWHDPRIVGYGRVVPAG